MEFKYFTSEKNLNFAIAVSEALREKARNPEFQHLTSVAEQLEKDISVNLNRAMRLASKVNSTHCLNIQY